LKNSNLDDFQMYWFMWVLCLYFIVCVVIRLPSQFWLLKRRNKALKRPNSFSYFFTYFLFAKTNFATTYFYSKENAKSTWDPWAIIIFFKIEDLNVSKVKWPKRKRAGNTTKYKELSKYSNFDVFQNCWFMWVLCLFFIVCVVIRLPSQFWLLKRRNKALGRPNSYSYFFTYFLFAKTNFATTNFYWKENAKSTWEPWAINIVFKMVYINVS
jgi:hypothetical protein